MYTKATSRLSRGGEDGRVHKHWKWPSLITTVKYPKMFYLVGRQRKHHLQFEHLSNEYSC